MKPAFPSCDLTLLLKLRIIVARFGEMDRAKWWNSKGQLGRLGSTTLRRGFPRTHFFAQARTVFALAGHRCSEVLGASNNVTLWRLPDPIEESFDDKWESWVDSAHDWQKFFEEVACLQEQNLGEALKKFDLVTSEDLKTALAKHRSAKDRNILLDDKFLGTDADIKLLALSFSHGSEGDLVVPYWLMPDSQLSA